MALGFSNKVTGARTQGSNNHITASWTPTANVHYLLAIFLDRVDSTDPAISSVAGNNLTWTVVDDWLALDVGATRRRLALYIGVGAAPTTGSTTITATATCDDIAAFIDECTGADSTTPTVAANEAHGTASGAATILATLPQAFADAVNNAAYAIMWYGASSDDVVPGTGFTSLQEGQVEIGLGMYSQYHVGQDLSVDASWTNNDSAYMIVVEVAAAAASNTHTDLRTQPRGLGRGLGRGLA